MLEDLVRFIADHRAEFITRVGEHVQLVVYSTAVASLAGIALGLFAARRPGLARPIVGLANLAQTIPSLALFGFLIPAPLIGGIGTRTALVALTLYAVLPILRGTITGVQNVDRAVIECAEAMGMTPRQVRWMVEWPLARPSILSGLRVAVVIGVGTATVASAIGAGGLGDYIFRGLAMVDSTVILAGALPAALLALGADALLAAAGRWSDPRTRHAPRAAGVLALVLAAALAGSWMAGRAAPERIVVGSKNFTEQIVLGEIVAQQIERLTQLPVERRFNLGGTAIAHGALVAGDLDVYVEYTGTALTAIFGEAPRSDSDAVLARVTEQYAPLGVTVLPRLGFNNTFAVMVRGEAAVRDGLATISDLARVAPGWTAGFGYEFLERPDGFEGLAAAYGLHFAAPPRVMDLNLIYRAVSAGEIDVTAGDATSGLVEAMGLVILDDDRRYFPVYDAVPLARTAVLLRHPPVDAALRALSGRLDAATMRRMNAAVDTERQSPRDVAGAFLDADQPRGSAP